MPTVPNEGVLILDKPAGLSSHDAIRRVGRLLGGVKVGHTGTLDPFATGVLPVLIGRATRVARFLNRDVKEYRATIRLGSATDTLDLAGTETETAEVPPLTDEAVQAVLGRFKGGIQQVPPMYSARKVNGRRLYKAARAGKTVERKPRDVTIYRLEQMHRSGERLGIEVACSAGTYVRVLADEIARALGTVGHLESLTRTASGRFRIDEAVPLPQVEGLVVSGRLDEHILTLNQALAHIPSATLNDDAARRIRFGGPVTTDDVVTSDPAPLDPASEAIRLLDSKETLLAVARLDGGPLFRTYCVLRAPR